MLINNTIKYIVIFIIMLMILKYSMIEKVEAGKNKENIAVIISLIFVIFIILLDLLFRSKCEKFIDLKPLNLSVPKQYLSNHILEDKNQTGLTYDNNMPGYYLLDNGEYNFKGIDNNKIKDLINNSIYKDLCNQQNFSNENIMQLLHPFIGKDRGYLNWIKMLY